MSYDGLAQSVPPDIGGHGFGQACMHEANRRFGVPMFRMDDAVADPDRVRRELRFWLWGAGVVDRLRACGWRRREAALVARILRLEDRLHLSVPTLGGNVWSWRGCGLP